MCQSAINLITGALSTVNSAEALIKIKPVVGLFIQTMDVCQPCVFTIFLADSAVELGLLCLHDEWPPTYPLPQVC